MKILLNSQFVKYVMIGGTGFILNISIFYYFHKILETFYITASLISFTLSTLFSFFAQKNLTFNNQSKRIKKQLIFYYIFTSVNILVNTILVFVMVEILFFNPTIAVIESSVVISVYGFFIYKNIIFKKDEKALSYNSSI